MHSLPMQINYKPIARIAPSHFYATVQCPHKLILAEAFDRRPLVPLSPNAYMGVVFHKLIERITKGQIQEETFNDEWEKEIKAKEDELRKEGIEFCLPLKSHIQNIGLKKIQIRNRLKARQSPAATTTQANEYNSEKWLQNEDGTVGGVVDLITKSGNTVIISDFKTGKITYDTIDEGGILISLVKEEYEYQLKLYAHLYFITYKVYPNHLYLFDMNNKTIEVSFSPAECQALYNQATKILQQINTAISKGDFEGLANRSVSNCTYCLYRPACRFYYSWLLENPGINDVTGQLIEINEFLNGNINITLNNNGNIFSVVEINPNFGIEKKYKVGDMVSLYSLRHRNENTFLMNKYSCIYKYPERE